MGRQQNQMFDFIKLSMKYSFGIFMFFAIFILIANPLPLAWRDLIKTWLPVDLGNMSILEYVSQFALTFLLLTTLSFMAMIIVKTYKD